MFKIKFTAILGSVAILFSSLTTPLMAGSLGIGITGIGAHLETTGTETLKTTSVKTSAQEDEQAAAVAGYVQYRFGDNGFVIGIDYMPGETSLGSSTTTKVDKLKSGDVTVVQSAKAVLTNHVTPYIETPALGPMGLFFKVGYAHAEIITEENLGTGSTYGNEDIFGPLVGFGFKGGSDQGIQLKFLFDYTDYDDASFVSGGTDVSSIIDAQSEVYAARFSVGYNF